MARRTVLFIPVLANQFLGRAHERGADAVVLDLEDAIAPGSKAAAREVLGAAVDVLVSRGVEVWVRVNNTPELLAEDLTSAVRTGVTGLMIPKVERALELATISSEIARLETVQNLPKEKIALCATLETPAGILAAASIGAAPRLMALALGGEDLAASLGIAPRHAALRGPGQTVVLAAAANGLESWGVVGSIANHTNIDRFSREVRLSRALGVTTIICIHPKQVSAVADIYRRSDEEVVWATDVVREYESAKKRGAGSIALHGQMIDEPVYLRAKRMLSS
jgi:citrate lyase subunit beta / citryl-CoA lyase